MRARALSKTNKWLCNIHWSASSIKNVIPVTLVSGGEKPDMEGFPNRR
ncbi:hypothetical protein [Longitalea arenae]|nr:hypothetical protein [Longitalea arenae]